MKKLLTMLLACSMLAGSLAACSNDTATDTDTSTDTDSTASDSTDTDADAELTGTFLDDIEEGAEILYWEMKWGGDDYGDVTQAFVDEFNESNEYGITVNLEMIPWDNYYSTFLTAVTSGTAPDVCTGATPTPIQYAVSGDSLNLDPLMECWEAEDSEILENIDSAMFELFTYEGVQYGLPYGIDPKQILYRSDYFEEAGITELPTTYDEFLDCCEVLQEAFPDKVTVLMSAGGSDAISSHIAFVLNSCNTTGFVDEDLNSTMTSDAQVENYTFLKTMYDEGYVSAGSAGYTSADGEVMWLSGEACILWGTSGNYIVGSDIEDVCHVLPNISGSYADGDGGYTQCVNALNGFNQGDYPNASLYFMKYWLENCETLLVDTGNGNLPTDSSLYELDYYQDSTYLMETFEYCVSQGQTMSAPASLYYQFSQMEGENTFAVAVKAILTGSSVEDALAACDEEITSMIEEYDPANL